jgi:hypothetical protein
MFILYFSEKNHIHVHAPGKRHLAKPVPRNAVLEEKKRYIFKEKKDNIT